MRYWFSNYVSRMKELEFYKKQSSHEDITDLANGKLSYEEFRNNVIKSKEGEGHSDAVETMLKMVLNHD